MITVDIITDSAEAIEYYINNNLLLILNIFNINNQLRKLPLFSVTIIRLGQ